MGKGTKRSHGKPIRGSVRAYHISPYMELLKRLKNSVPSFDEAYRLRDMYKQLTADRLRAALRMGGIYNPLTGTEEIIIFLKQNPRYADLADFVSCTLDYYNNPNLCTVRVQLRNYPSSNQGREGLRSKKNVIRGIKDMQKVFSQDIKQVLKVLETCRFVTEEQRLIIGKYRTISRSVGFLSLLFQTLYAKPLPENNGGAVQEGVQCRSESGKLLSSGWKSVYPGSEDTQGCGFVSERPCRHDSLFDAIGQIKRRKWDGYQRQIVQ